MVNDLEVILFNINSTYKELNDLNFKRINFEEAVVITTKIELSAREENEDFNCEFVITNSSKDLYKGVFNFGSGEYTNLYHQIKDKVPKIKVKKEYQSDKVELLNKIENIDEELKKIIETKVIINPENISKLSKWKRKTIYIVGSLAVASTIFISFVYVADTTAYKSELEKEIAKAEESQKLNVLYENELLNVKDNNLYKELMDQKKITDNQKKVLAINFLEKKELKALYELFDKETLKVNNFILANTLKDKVVLTKEFNELYPSNEGKFAVAYYNKNYDLLLNVKNVRMNEERSKMKTYALLKTGKIDLAKAELNNNNDEQLETKIIKYEGLTAEIKTLQEKANTLKNNKKKKKERNLILKEVNKKLTERSEL